MEIFLYKDFKKNKNAEGQDAPSYTEDDLRRMVEAEQVSASDLVWHEGLADWQPLNTVVSLPAFAVPYVQTNVRQGGLLGGSVCFLLGLGVMLYSVWFFVIYGPLFIVAFILSIVAMAQRQVTGGIILLLATLIIPACIGIYRAGMGFLNIFP